MKIFKKITILLMMTALFLGMSSCLVLVNEKKGHDNGHHYGWRKNPKNPHHIFYNTNENKLNGKSDEKSNGKQKHNKHRG